MARFLRQRTELPAPPERVWEHLVDRSLLQRWFGGEVELVAEPGGQVRVVDGPVRLVGFVIRAEPSSRLSWTWSLDGIGRPTLVDMELRAVGGSTALTVTETILDVGDAPIPGVDAVA